MNETSASRQFQLGLLALQNQLVSQSTLVAAFETWWSDRSRQFGQILVELGAISDASHQELVKLLGDTHSIEKRDSTIRECESDLANAMGDASVATERVVPGMDLSAATLKWAANDSSDALKPAQTDRSRVADNDRFRIVKQHARGGLGVVFVAEDQQLHRPVALKKIRDDRGDSDWVRSKFIQEAEITGQLEHPGIVPIYALGIDTEGKPYYAMRFIQGKDLSTRIREFHRDRIATKEAFDGPSLKHFLRRFLDVCNAMEYAHSRGILHRDLKPANVMLGEFGETLVVDWGLAKVLPGYAKNGIAAELPISSPQIVVGEKEDLGSETFQGQFMGTVAYASPEQLRGHVDRLGPCSDVYSLGAILFELLTGYAPITDKRNKPSSVADDIENNRIPTLRSLVSACPAPLESICKKSMAARIENRYQSATDLKQDLEAWLDDEPCHAHRDTLLSRAKRWIRHHPAFVGIFTTFFVCSTVASVALFEIANRTNRQLLDANAIAESARDDATASTQLFTSALQSTDPDRLGAKVTVAETLRASESALEIERAMNPSRKVHVASAMMESYLGLGLNEDAMRIAEYMNRVCDEYLAPSSPDTSLSRCHLATTYWLNGKPNEAIALLEKHVPLLVNAFPESNADVLAAQDNLAFMYANIGRKKEAEKLFRSTLAKYYKYHLLDQPNALQCIGNLVQILVESDRRQEGIDMLREAIVRAKKKLGPTHTVTLRLLQNLGEHLTDPSEALEALNLSQTAYDGSMSRYGKDHPEVVVFRNSLSANLMLLKKWGDVIPLLEQSESDGIRLYADKTDQARNVRSALINAYLQTERYTGVERIARKALLPEFKDFAGISPQRAKVVLAMALVRQNRPNDANEVIADLKLTPEFQALSPTCLAVLQGLEGEIAFTAGDYEKATDLLSSSWEKLSTAEPMEIYSQVPRSLAIALTKLYEQKQDETNRMQWLEKAKSLGYEGK